MRDDAEDETGPLEAVALFWTEDAVVEAAEDEEVEEDNEAATATVEAEGGGGAGGRLAFLDDEDEKRAETVGANAAVTLLGGLVKGLGGFGFGSSSSISSTSCCCCLLMTDEGSLRDLLDISLRPSSFETFPARQSRREVRLPSPPPTDVDSSPKWPEPERPLSSFIHSRSDGLWSWVWGGGPSPPVQLLAQSDSSQDF